MSRWMRVCTLALVLALLTASLHAFALNNSRDNKITKDDTPTSAWVYTYVLMVYDKPTKESEVLEEIGFAKPIVKLKESSGWAKVMTSNDVIGFCNAKQLTETNPNTQDLYMYCQVYEPNVYRFPSADSSIMGHLARNEKVHVVAVTPRGDWLRIEEKGYYAYIPRPYLDYDRYVTDEEDLTLAWVNQDALDIYYDEDQDSVIGTAKFGQEVTLIKNHIGPRAKVRSKTGLIGYCDLSGLTTENPTSLSITAYTQVSGSYLFTSPNDQSGHRSVESGEEMTIDAVDSRRFWARVKYQDQYYYVPFVFLDGKRLASGSYKIIHTTQAAHIKSGTKQSSSIVATVPKGQELILIGATDYHARVATPADENGVRLTGYIEIDYLK